MLAIAVVLACWASLGNGQQFQTHEQQRSSSLEDRRARQNVGDASSFDSTAGLGDRQFQSQSQALASLLLTKRPAGSFQIAGTGELSSVSGIGRRHSQNLARKGKEPPSNSADERFAVARRGGGGSALWKHNDMMEVLSRAADINMSEADDGGDGEKKGLSMEDIKKYGIAGTIAYILTELAFWIIAFPLASTSFYNLNGHWPDFGDNSDRAAVLAFIFAGANIARLAVPLRFGVAFAFAPWVDENIVQKLGFGDWEIVIEKKGETEFGE